MNQSAANDGVAGALEHAARSGLTGAIKITGRDGSGTIYLTEGRIYWAKLSGTSDVQEVVSRLPVNGATLARVRWQMSNGFSLAAAVAKVGGVDEEAVRRTVREFADRPCRALVALADATCEVMAGLESPVGVFASWPVAELLGGAVRPGPAPAAAPSAPPRGRARGSAPQGPVRLAPRAADPVVRLDDVEWRVIAALAAPLEPTVVAERSGLSTADVLAAVARLRDRRLVLPPVGDGAAMGPAPAPATRPSPVREPVAPPVPPVRPLGEWLPEELAPAAVKLAETAPAAKAQPDAWSDAAWPAARPERAGGPDAGSLGSNATPVERRSTALRRLIHAVRKI